MSSEKNPNAVELGRLGGEKGGPARRDALTPARRSQIARAAAKARWDNPPPRKPGMALNPTHRRFVLQRDEDITGVSGTGVVAEGVMFSNGVVALQWTSEFPTSVVFHQRGMESVDAVHGHGGATRVVFLDA